MHDMLRNVRNAETLLSPRKLRLETYQLYQQLILAAYLEMIPNGRALQAFTKMILTCTESMTRLSSPYIKPRYRER